jgi:hypothetical protein
MNFLPIDNIIADKLKTGPRRNIAKVIETSYASHAVNNVEVPAVQQSGNPTTYTPMIINTSLLGTRDNMRKSIFV